MLSLVCVGKMPDDLHLLPNRARGEIPLRWLGETGAFRTRIDSTAMIIRVFPIMVAVALLTSPEVTMSTLQQGHSSLLSSHSRMHSLWKMWSQYFEEIIVSPSSTNVVAELLRVRSNCVYKTKHSPRMLTNTYCTR